MQTNTAKLTFEDLRHRFGTGRAYTISGSGKDRVMGYRTGVMCRLGDIEESEWAAMMKDLISHSGEDKLFSQLRAFLSQHNYRKMSPKELEMEALELHSRRIFDDEAWIDFIAFNEQYRPQRLIEAHQRRVVCDCCKKVCFTTQAIIDRNSGSGMIPCPVCGKYTSYRRISESEAMLLPLKKEIYYGEK